MDKKYLIPNTILTIILANRKKLIRMEKRVQWENKYLIPNATLKNILTTYMKLRSKWTRVSWIKNT